MRFFPTDDAYYPMLSQMADLLTEATQQLDLLLTDLERAGLLAETVRQTEHRADELLHDIVRRLTKTFTTPFDRYEIFELAQRLEVVIDQVENVAESVETLHLKRVEPGMRELAGVLIRAAQAVSAAVGALRDPNLVLEHTRVVKLLEEEGDAVYNRVMTELFQDPPDPLEIIRQKTIYDMLEDAIDSCEDVGDKLESVAVKEL